MGTYLAIVAQAVITVVAIVLFTRLRGLRSYSKISGYDFALTVATGSILASTLTSPDRSVWIGVVALASVFALQIVFGRIRLLSDALERVTDNEPLMIVENGRILEHNRKKAGLSMDDLHGQLRQHNVHRLSDVRALVFETTGDVSVLHGPGRRPEVDEEILKVRR